MNFIRILAILSISLLYQSKAINLNPRNLYLFKKSLVHKSNNDAKKIEYKNEFDLKEKEQVIDQSDSINSQNIVRNSIINPKLKYSSTRLGKFKESLFTEIRVAKPLIKELNNGKQGIQANSRDRSNINHQSKLIHESNNEKKRLIRRAPKGGGGGGGGGGRGGGGGGGRGSRSGGTSNTSHSSSPKDGLGNKVDTSPGSSTKPNNVDSYGNVYPGGIYYPMGPYVRPHSSTSLSKVVNMPTMLYVISVILLCYT